LRGCELEEGEEPEEFFDHGISWLWGS
jgi:hypothetical protein